MEIRVQMIERIVHPRLPRLDCELVLTPPRKLAESGIRLLHDVHLKADLLEFALDPDCALLVRLPAHAHREIDRDWSSDTGLLHEALRLREVVLVRREARVIA